MRPVYGNNRAYNVLVRYVRWSFRRMFHSVSYIGLDNIPSDSAVIFSPNHVNTLLDALAILSAQKTPVVFAARADLFKKPALARALNFLKIMPIYRIRDGADSLSGNDATFQTAVQTLKSGLPFCIFPEGRHSQEPGLLPLRKGIARIALKAAEDVDKPVVIVPVGLVYEDYTDFRTNLKINIGEPMPVWTPEDDDLQETDEESGERKHSRKLLQKLTEKMQALITRHRRDKFARDTRLVKILRLPMVPFAGLLLLPGIGVFNIFKNKIADKAFLNSIRYVACYLINPIIWLLLGLIALILLLCIPGGLPLWLRIVLPFVPLILSPFAPEVWYGAIRQKRR